MSEMRLIDANALKEWLGCDGDNKYRSMIMHEIADRIDEQPTIDAVPVVHGRWVYPEIGMAWNHICSICKMGNRLTCTEWRYCPNCGAKMDGGAEGC